ncbi:MAG TPA: histidine ammonia-lyase [Plasticicumulans sp.]|uniref:histidine ammonia-lyase n=1 Tax=Plasticicumulans sp. TaxID=2307179 RepID=UPI002C144F15|nr:histidine ammonia-lyase [Plasticicumulans sp.]HMW30158.1 histidine ammonia-lyase [Plasticicumulans sp.]
MNASPILLRPGALDLALLRAVQEGEPPLCLEPGCRTAIDAAQATVTRVLAEGRTVYGVNTGFGLLAQTRIAAADLDTLQRSLVRSHAAGVGAPLPESTVRMVLVLKIASLARGHSGVRAELVEALLALYTHGIRPLIPSRGSVGASGDLAPLAHLAAVLIGEGEATYRGVRMSGAAALAAAGLAPLALAPKEGLALLNGTQVSTALALEGLFAAENLLVAALVTGSLSVEAALGSRRPFDARIHAVRGHAAQIDIAAACRALLDHSEIERSHEHCGKVQDPYSLRCQPQVMGACLEQIRHAAAVLLTEANAVSDNPLVFAADDDILSGGNFHAEPVAFAADGLALALAETGALAERRIAMLIDANLSNGLPAFLVAHGGLNSGFMAAQVTAAALASENKSLAHPASVDSLPTSANQEDHVSMATFAARRLAELAANTAGIVAIEWLAAAQGVDLRAPHRSSAALRTALALLRAAVPFYERDRCFAPDIARATALIEGGQLRAAVRDALPAGLLPSG